MSFSFPWVVGHGEQKAGPKDGGVNGVHGHLAGGPGDHAGRPGRGSLTINSKTRKEKELIAPPWSGPTPRAAEGSGRAPRFSEKRQLAGLRQVGFQGFDHASGERRLVLRCIAFAVADTLECGNQLVDAGGGGFVVRGVGRAVPNGRG